MLVALYARIDDHELAGFNDFIVNVVVQGFAVLREDGGERNAPAFGQCHAFHLTHDVLFYNADLDGIPGHRMHQVTQIAGVVQCGNFNIFFDKALGNHGFD